MADRDKQDRHWHPETRACRAATSNCRRNTNDSLTKGIATDATDSHLRHKASAWQATPLGMTIGCSVTLLAEGTGRSLTQLYRIRWVRQPDATRSRRIE